MNPPLPMSDDESLHQPHDKLFKAGFGNPVHAAAFLRGQLPPEVAALVKWDRLRLEPGTFVDSHYRRSESDLLFSAPLRVEAEAEDEADAAAASPENAKGGAECLIHVLFEHQREQDPLMALRLLRYMVRIWERVVEGRPGTARLPVIVPVVLAQSGEVWGIEPRFAALFGFGCRPVQAKGDRPEFAPLSPFVPDFRFRLVELARLPFGAMRGTPTGILVLRVLKAESEQRLLDEVVWDEALLTAVPREFFEMMVRYILCADIDREAFERRLEAVTDPATRASAMTLAQQYLQEGRQEGLREGIERGRQEGVIDSLRSAVLEALNVRFGPVAAAVREAVIAVDDEGQLRSLLRAAIKAESAGEFVRVLESRS